MSLRRRIAAAFTAAVTAVTGLAILPAPPPASAAAPAPVILNASNLRWLETQAMPDDGNGRRVTVTFLVQHAQGRRITGLAIDSDWNGSDSTGSVGVTSVSSQFYGSGTTNHLQTSRVTYTFNPGKPGGFGCSLNPFGGNRTRRVDEPLRFRVVDSTNERSAPVSANIHVVEDTQCAAAQDFAFMYDQSQSATTATPGQSVDFSFRCDDADANVLSDDDECHKAQVRWRRLNDNATGGTQVRSGIGDNNLHTVSMSFPSRGRYVVEALLGNEDDNNFDDDHSHAWYRLGAVDVNDAASTLSPSLAFSGSGVVAGNPPSVNQGGTANAVLSAGDGGTGTVQVAEWDATGDGTYERREYTVPGTSLSTPGLSSSQRTQSVNTSTHGLKTVGVRVVDNGALDAADSLRRTATTSANIRVNAIPTASSFSVSTNEDTARAINLVGSDADSQPAPLSYTVLSQPDDGDLTCVGSACTYTPDPNFHGADSFTYRVADGPVSGQAWASSNTATVTITVNPVNDAPTADPQQLTTPEDVALPITLTGSDVEPGTLTYSIDADPVHGTLSGTGANRTYTPDQDFNGADSFVFRVTDSGGLSSTATVSITVTPVNDAPVAIDQQLATDEDTALPLSLAATDVDGDSLTFVAGQATNGAVSCTGTACTYTPDDDFNGTDSFTFTVDDGNGGTDTGTVTIEVAPVNDAPVARAMNVTLDEDTTERITLDGTDVDGDSLTFDVTAGPSHGSTTPVGGADVDYTPDANFHGADEFTFEVDDGELTDEAVVALTIVPVNDLPDIADQSFTTAEDVATILSIVASDVDGDTLSWSHTEPDHGQVVGALPDVAYLPDADFHGTDTFDVTVDDGNGGQRTATITIEVTPVNDAPVATASAVTTDEDVATPVTLQASDVDGDALTFSITTEPTQGTLVCPGDGPSCTYTPDQDVHGSDLVVFEVSDGQATDTASVSITIEPVNDAPVALDGFVTTLEDEPVGISLVATDVDGDALTYSIASGPSAGTLAGDPPELVYTPNLNDNGIDVVTFTVTDGAESDSATITIDIEAVNDAPVAQPVSAGTPEDTAVAFTLAATDVDTDQADLAFSIPEQPANGIVACVGARNDACVFTPATDFHGLVQFTYEVTDGDLVGTAVVTVAVASENDAPVADDLELATDEDTALAVTLSATDADGDDLDFAVTSSPTDGTLTGTAPNLVYTPSPNFSGTDSFTFSVSDGELTDTGTVTLTVSPVNDAPVALPLSVSVTEEAPKAFQLEAEDVEGDPLTFAVTSQPAHGQVACDATGACTYTPDEDYNGADAFTFSATDPSGASSSATVSVVVNAAPLVETRLVAQPVVLTLQPVFRATLTRVDTGEPLAGRTVRFVAGGSLRCTAVTNANGFAQCGTPLLDLAALLQLGYDAYFDGDHDFAASHADGPFVRLKLKLF